ncbi:MAG: hypothetical protein ACJ0DI_14735 [bacterium]
MFKSAWFSPNLLQKQGFFQKKQAKIAVFYRNYLKLVYILQDKVEAKFAAQGVPGFSKDGREHQGWSAPTPRVPCALFGFLPSVFLRPLLFLFDF